MAKDHWGDSMLAGAVANNRLDIVRIMIDEVQNPDKRDDFITYKDADGKTALYYAVRDGNHKAIKMLLDA